MKKNTFFLHFLNQKNKRNQRLTHVCQWRPSAVGGSVRRVNNLLPTVEPNLANPFTFLLICRIEEAKRAIKRPSDDRYDDSDRKRTSNDRRFEAPPAPRFDSTMSSRSGYDRSSDKKRDDYVKSSYERTSSSAYAKDSRTDSRTATKSRYDSYDRSATSAVWSQPAAVSLSI